MLLTDKHPQGVASGLFGMGSDKELKDDGGIRGIRCMGEAV